MKSRRAKKEYYCYKHVTSIHSGDYNKNDILFHALSKEFLCDIKMTRADTIIFPFFDCDKKWYIYISTTYIYFTSKGIQLLSHSTRNLIKLYPNDFENIDCAKKYVTEHFADARWFREIGKYRFYLNGANDLQDFVFKSWNSTNIFKILEDGINKYASLNLLNELK